MSNLAVDPTDYSNNLLKPLEQSWQDYYGSYQPLSVLIGFVAHSTGWNSCLYCKSGQIHMGTHCCCIARWMCCKMLSKYLSFITDYCCSQSLAQKLLFVVRSDLTTGSDHWMLSPKWDREHHGKGQREGKSQSVGMMSVNVSSELDVADALMKPLLLWFTAQDLDEIGTGWQTFHHW